MPTKFVDNVHLGGYKITNLADPTLAQDAATRAYVLAQLSGLTSYTDEQARDAIGAALVNGSNITITINDASDTITIGVSGLTSAQISDFSTAAVAAANAGVIDADTLATYTPANLRDRATHTGTQSADTLTDGTTNKAFLATERTKLTGIATGATVNSPDATLLARANHTGTQAISTIAAATDGKIFGRANAAGAGAGQELTAAQAKAILAIVASDVSDFSTAADARVAAVVTPSFINTLSGVDADSLNGSTAAQLQTTITAAIVNGAGTTLDTLNELAAALGNDANFSTTVTNSLATKTTKYSANVGDGTNSVYAITHSLNTRDVEVQVYDAATYETVFCGVARNTVNQVTLTFGATVAVSAYRVVIIG